MNTEFLRGNVLESTCRVPQRTRQAMPAAADTVCIHFNQNMLSNDKRLPGSEIGFKNE
jgi:hypothetical protein